MDGGDDDYDDDNNNKRVSLRNLHNLEAVSNKNALHFEIILRHTYYQTLETCYHNKHYRQHRHRHHHHHHQ
jgi:hypothetical protein